MNQHVTLNELAKQQGLLTQTEAAAAAGMDVKTFCYATSVVEMDFYQFDNTKRRFYKLKDVKSLAKKLAKIREIRREKIQLTGKCKKCKKLYTFERVVEGRAKTIEKRKTKISKLRKYCDDCVNVNRSHSEATKKKIGQWTKDWWAGISYQRRAAISKKMSTKKTKWWAGQDELREDLSEAWSEATSGAWERWRERNEYSREERG
jgi:hypothetical protein